MRKNSPWILFCCHCRQMSSLSGGGGGGATKPSKQVVLLGNDTVDE